jgi:hypothetical protein
LTHVESTVFVKSADLIPHVEEDGVVYIAMDCSKIGSSSNLPQLAGSVIVDACQMRLSAKRLNALLERGNLVVTTLSKFYCGPAFCGLLLQKGPSSSLPRVLQQSLGLYLRFAVATQTLSSYLQLPVSERIRLMQLFRGTVMSELAARPNRFRMRDATRREKMGWPDADNEEFAMPSIVSFAVLDEAGATLDAKLLAHLYQQLASCHGVLVGQAVDLADGAVLRISCDARWIIRMSHEADNTSLRNALAFLKHI